MFFNAKPLLYLQLLDKSFRYLAIQPKKHSILDYGEVVFDTNIVEDGEIVNPSLLETRLDALVKEKKWKNAKTHILVFNEFLVVREETVPIQLDTNEIRDYINLHMNQTIRVPYDNPRFDFEVVEKNEEEQKIIMVAYPGDAVEKYQEILQKVSLKPAVADVIPISAYRGAKKSGIVNNQAGNHTLLLEWNPYNMSLMVFHEDLPTFTRFNQFLRLSDAWEITEKGEWVWKYSNVELEMALDDQLNGLERFIDFYTYSVLSGEGEISDLVLVGYYPDLNHLKQRLLDRFDFEITLLDLPVEIPRSFYALYGLTLKEEEKKSAMKLGGRSR